MGKGTLQTHSSPCSFHFSFTIVKNACINQIAKQGLSTEQLDLPHYSIAEEESNQLDETAIETVLTAVRKLPEKTQRVVQLVMCQGCTYQETANKLEVSINTVKTLLKAGRKELRSELKGYKKIFLLFMLFSRSFTKTPSNHLFIRHIFFLSFFSKFIHPPTPEICLTNKSYTERWKLSDNIFQAIQACWRGKASREQIELVQSWLNTSEENKELFEKLSRTHYQLTYAQTWEQIDSKKGREKLNSRLISKKKSIHWKYFAA